MAKELRRRPLSPASSAVSSGKGPFAGVRKRAFLLGKNSPNSSNLFKGVPGRSRRRLAETAIRDFTVYAENFSDPAQLPVCGSV
jgi:hypothetical protein